MRKPHHHAVFAWFFLAALVTACGTQFGGNYTGVESGSCGGAGISATFTLNLIQDGKDLRGTWETGSTTTSNYEAGSVSGTANGKNIDGLTWTTSYYGPSNTQSQRFGTYTGSATLEGDSLVATRVSGAAGATGTPTCGAFSTTINATKQK
jgi:hypothetical protein